MAIFNFICIIQCFKGKGKAVPYSLEECRRGAHLTSISHWACRWLNHWSLWHIASVTPFERPGWSSIVYRLDVLLDVQAPKNWKQTNQYLCHLWPQWPQVLLCLWTGKSVPSVLWHCWLGGRKGIRPVKNMGGWWRWALVSPDGVVPSRMVGVSVSVNLPCTIKSTSSLLAPAHMGDPGKRAAKWLWCGVWWCEQENQ